MNGSARVPACLAPMHGGAPVPVPPSTDNWTAMAHEWPLRDFLELGPLPGAVPCARYHVRQVLWEWRLTDLSDSAELLVSELVTNAIVACRSMNTGSPVRLWRLSDTARILILVQDDSPRPPARAVPEADAEAGRGLLLVEAISSRWDWYVPHPRRTGKVTWAVLEAQE